MRIVRKASFWLAVGGVLAAALSLSPVGTRTLTVTPAEGFIAPVPEPSTLALLSAGIVAAWWRSRGRRR